MIRRTILIAIACVAFSAGCRRKDMSHDFSAKYLPPSAAAAAQPALVANARPFYPNDVEVLAPLGDYIGDLRVERVDDDTKATEEEFVAREAARRGATHYLLVDEGSNQKCQQSRAYPVWGEIAHSGAPDSERWAIYLLARVPQERWGELPKVLRPAVAVIRTQGRRPAR